MNNSSNFNFNNLPYELIVKIFNELSFNNQIQCKFVCLKWKWIIENLIIFNSILISSNRHRSASKGKLCTIKLHQFEKNNLFINLIDNFKFILFNLKKVLLLSRIRALKFDLDNKFEMNSNLISLILFNLLSKLYELEHLELRCFLKEQFRNILNRINSQLIISNRNLKHLSFRKIEYMDFLYIDNNLKLFEPLFNELVNLTVFECDFCILNFNNNDLYASSSSLKSIKKKQQLSKLFLPNANNLIGVIDDDYSNLNALALGIVDYFILNQLFLKFKHLERLEIKISEEVAGRFIINKIIKQLYIHSLGIRENINNIIDACKSLEHISLINCLVTKETIQILIDNLLNSLISIDIRNDYYDNDHQFDYFISLIYEKCTKCRDGYFKNVYLKEFYPFICRLAINNPNNIYSLHLDYFPNYPDFDLDNLEILNNLPINLIFLKLNTDYNY